MITCILTRLDKSVKSSRHASVWVRSSVCMCVCKGTGPVSLPPVEHLPYCRNDSVTLLLSFHEIAGLLVSCLLSSCTPDVTGLNAP
jgi:hypothetical protein